jgi:hypothetical protein
VAPASSLAATRLIANSGANWTSLYHVPQNHYCQLTVCECMTYILHETGLAKRLLRNVPFTLKQDVDTQSGQLFFLFVIKAFLLEALIVAHLVNKFLAFHDTLLCAQVLSLHPILSQLIQSAHSQSARWPFPLIPLSRLRLRFFRYAVAPCSFPVLHAHLISTCVLQIQPNSLSLI